MINPFVGINFANPYWFLLLLLIPLLVVHYVFRHRKQIAPLNLPSLSWTENLTDNWKVKLRHLPFALRMITIALLTVVMARPQSSNKQKQVHIEGIDIVMAMDISGSMLAQDLRPNRIEAAKKVAIEFIDKRPNDRIGLVIFSGEAFTQCPLTTDHAVLKSLFKPLKSGMIEDGTAIGDGLATALNRIKESEAISKVVILLTDGVQNRGNIDPLTAAEIAKTFNIRVYTIGLGTKGMAPMPVMTPFGEQIMSVPVDIDEKSLSQIANLTDGKYFRATDNQKLSEIYNEIDKLERSKIDVNIFQNKTEEFGNFLWLALLLLALEWTLRLTYFRIKP
jgi:Ca-activated chloride channel family protein